MNHRSAFTLVELLVVIAILAVLAGIALPMLSNIREQGMKARSIANLKQLVSANMAYLADHGRYAPASNQANTRRWCAGKGEDDEFDPALGYLAPYLGESRQVNPCPKLEQMLGSSDSFELGTGGYGYNDNYVGGLPQGMDGGYYAWDWNDPDYPRVSARAAQVPRLASTVMFTTTALAKSDGLQEYPFCPPPFWDFGYPAYSFSMRPTPAVHFRFGGKAIVAWCDGHVTLESCDPREVGWNPYGGDAKAQKLGWFGPDEQNGYWNPHSNLRAGR